MFTLDQVVPWGRSFDEYCRMFGLTEGDLQGFILGCADGPASFNTEARRRGSRVVSCDPIYTFSGSELRQRIAETRDQILTQTRQNQNEFVWASIGSIEELERVRMKAMDCFLADYESGERAGRYVAADCTALPFKANSFDLVLCSHFLFLYSDQLGENFHHDAILELCRVAHEVRVFPLLALGGQRSQYVSSVVHQLRAAGCHVSVETVPYEFQRGGNEMMRVRRSSAR